MEIPPITVEVKFDKMSPQMENFIDYVIVLLITILVYVYLIIFDFIIKRIVFYRQNRLYYLEVNNEIN